jgi:hypothetical protein
MHDASSPQSSGNLPLTSRQRFLIRAALSVTASAFGDIGIALERGQRSAVQHYLERLQQMMALLDSIGWYDHDERQEPLTAAAQQVAATEIAELEAWGHDPTVDRTPGETTKVRDTIEAFRQVVSPCRVSDSQT